jgi:glycosyltransferase involved in cell wall biosynthesis
MNVRSPKLKVALVASSDPRSAAGFSGTLNSMYRALSARFDLHPVHVGPLLKLANKLGGAHRRMTGRSANYYFHPVFSRLAGRWVEAKLRRLAPDVVVNVAASSVTAHVRTDRPVIYCTDGTFRALARLYPGWRNLPQWNSANGEEAEQVALDQAAAVVMSSDWARQSAVEDYRVDPGKISVLPYGPNLRDDLLPAAELPPPGDPAQELHLLYTGMDWLRKGGNFAFAVAAALNAAGRKTHLHIVGRMPSDIGAPDFVTYHGLINKDEAGGPERMAALYRQAHMFILPTIADATPVVFSEAAAFSLPSITFDVGGVSSAVRDGESGLVLRPDTDAETVARLIDGIVTDPARFAALRRSTFAWSQEVANWQSWAASISALADRALLGEGAAKVSHAGDLAYAPKG